MSAPYSSRASAIIAEMRAVLPATSPTGKSNCAIAMRRVSIMSDSRDEHVECRHDRSPLARQVRLEWAHGGQVNGGQQRHHQHVRIAAHLKDGNERRD